MRKIPILLNKLNVAEVVNAEGSAPICLVCEHASAFIPPELNDLGLAEGNRESHAAFDIGAEALARAMSDILGAPLVLAKVSRLVCDLNRPPASFEATPALVEDIEVPGNRDLPESCRMTRAKFIYHPFHNEVCRVLNAFTETPALVTLHSFTSSWLGVPRETEVGLLHDQDDRLACAMLGRVDGFRTELNQPYSAKDGVMHTLHRHGDGKLNVMIEVRNNLLDSAEAVDKVAASLSTAISAALAEGVEA